MATEGSFSPTSRRGAASRGQARSTASPQPPVRGSLDAIKPLLAGAHARGMADALEMAGIAAVLIDREGMVLHAGPSARSLFCAEFSLQAEHLVAADSDSTRSIQSLISDALGAGPQPEPIEIRRRDGGGFQLRARRVPGAADDSFQLLKVLILIEELAPAGTRN
jgi:hypothetical protein